MNINQLVLESVTSKIFKNPKELLKWMDCIEYGWLDKNYKKHYTFDDWFEQLRIHPPEVMFKYKVGTCYEQTLFEYYIFKNQLPEYEVKLIHVQQYYVSNHAFLIFRKPKDKNWFYFEHSFAMFKGIYGPISYNNIITKVKTQMIHASKLEGVYQNKGFNIVNMNPNNFNKVLTGTEFYNAVKYNWNKSE